LANGTKSAKFSQVGQAGQAWPSFSRAHKLGQNYCALGQQTEDFSCKSLVCACY